MSDCKFFDILKCKFSKIMDMATTAINPTRKFFDSVAAIWDKSVSVFPSEIDYIIQAAGISEGDMVLDAGTGTGVLLPFLSLAVGDEGHVLGVDLSSGMLGQARRKFSSLPNVELRLADVETDTIPGEFDRIMMYCMFPHLNNPVDTLRWLVKVNLRPGGTLTIAHPQSRHQINGIHRHNDSSVHSDHLTPCEEFCQTLAVAGLTVDFARDDSDYYINVN